MKWKLKWAAPEFPTLESPLEIQVVTAPTPPSRVRIEVWESDARKFEVDDYDDQKLADEHDDLIATFEGSLTAHPSRANGFLFKDVDGKPELAASQGSDEVTLRFEGEPATTKHVCPIPASKSEPQDDTDGEFYELFVLVFDATAPAGSKPLARSQVHFVRRRTDVLLAVEPLNQASASLSNNSMGKRILERFGGNGNRNWGDIALQVRGHGPITVNNSGCSYTVMTMMMRYLRTMKAGTAEGTPPADIEWETLYDKTAGRTLPSASAPWEVKDFTSVPRAKEVDKVHKQLIKDHKGEWRKKPKSAAPTSFSKVPAGDPQLPASDRAVRRSSVPAHWFVPRVIWWIRDGDGNGSDPTVNFQRGQLRWQLFPKAGGNEFIPMVDSAGKPVFRYGYPNESSSGFSRTKDSLLFPPRASETPQLFSKLGLKVTNKNLKTPDPKWKDWVVRHLRRGLPVIANVKSGRYLREGHDPGGHYIVIVGFRTVNGQRRFILNDPAGSKKLQYEALFESDLKPTEGPFDEIQKMEVGVAILDPSQKNKKKRVLAQTTVTVSAADWIKGQEVTMHDAGGNPFQVKLSAEADHWREGSFILGSVKGSIEATENGGALLSATEFSLGLKQKARNKTGKARFQASNLFPVHDTRTVAVTLKPHTSRTTGPRPRKKWEGHSDVLVERRRHDTLHELTVFEPKAGWPKGAARFLPFDGRTVSGS